jgi:hypothetical protein
MSVGLGPREYEVEPVHVPFFRRGRTRAVLSVVLVLAVGGGAFGITQAFSGGSTTTASSLPAGRGGPASLAPLGTAGSRVVGTVDRLGSTSFEVQTRANGTVTFTVSSSTTFRSLVGTVEHFADLKIGDSVAVKASSGSSGHEASAVVVLPSRAGAGGGGFGAGGGPRFGANFTVGTVQSVSSNSFTILGRTSGSGTGVSTTQTTYTVKVGPATTFRVGAGTSGTIADLKVGDTVLVNGSTSGSTVTSTLVGILPSGGFRPGGGFGGPAAGSSGSPASS